MKKRLKVWTRKQKWHIRTATFQFWRKSFTISWTFRMMLSKHTFCEHEQCSLIKLAFQLVCWDNLGLMVLRGGGALCIWYPQCSVCCDGQRQATMLDFAGPDLVALLAELNSHSAFSANPGGNGAPSLLPERASETGHWATTKSGNKMGSPLGDFPESGLPWTVKWLPWLEGRLPPQLLLHRVLQLTTRTALLHGETLQEAQVHSGDKVDTPLTPPSALADWECRLTTVPYFPDSAARSWLSEVRHSMWSKNHGAFEWKVLSRI